MKDITRNLAMVVMTLQRVAQEDPEAFDMFQLDLATRHMPLIAAMLAAADEMQAAWEDHEENAHVDPGEARRRMYSAVNAHRRACAPITGIPADPESSRA